MRESDEGGDQVSRGKTRLLDGVVKQPFSVSGTNPPADVIAMLRSRYRVPSEAPGSDWMQSRVGPDGSIGLRIRLSTQGLSSAFLEGRLLAGRPNAFVGEFRPATVNRLILAFGVIGACFPLFALAGVLRSGPANAPIMIILSVVWITFSWVCVISTMSVSGAIDDVKEELTRALSDPGSFSAEP